MTCTKCMDRNGLEDLRALDMSNWFKTARHAKTIFLLKIHSWYFMVMVQQPTQDPVAQLPFLLSWRTRHVQQTTSLPPTPSNEPASSVLVVGTWNKHGWTLPEFQNIGGLVVYHCHLNSKYHSTFCILLLGSIICPSFLFPTLLSKNDLWQTYRYIQIFPAEVWNLLRFNSYWVSWEHYHILITYDRATKSFRKAGWERMAIYITICTRWFWWFRSCGILELDTCENWCFFLKESRPMTQSL